jgi:hypothetical protein
MTRKEAENELMWIESLRILDRKRPNSLPEVMYKFLESGIESPAVIELAGIFPPPTAWADVLPLWQRVLADFGIPPIGDEKAALYLGVPEAKRIGAKFLAGETDYAATIHALEELNFRYGHRDYLHDFCILCSYLDYALETKDTKRLAEIERELIDTVRKLVALPDFDPRQTS